MFVWFVHFQKCLIFLRHCPQGFEKDYVKYIHENVLFHLLSFYCLLHHPCEGVNYGFYCTSFPALLNTNPFRHTLFKIQIL